MYSGMGVPSRRARLTASAFLSPARRSWSLLTPRERSMNFQGPLLSPNSILRPAMAPPMPPMATPARSENPVSPMTMLARTPTTTILRLASQYSLVVTTFLAISAPILLPITMPKRNSRRATMAMENADTYSSPPLWW